MAFVLGIIPARGGSKGIANKNIIDVSGKPLIAYTIEASKNSERLDKVILSTDSKKIADCAAYYGLTTTGLRPAKLSTDKARSVDTVIYEIDKFQNESNTEVDAVVLLQPTTPMRKGSDIDNALDLYFKSGANSLISVYEANFIHPHIMYYQHGDRLRPVLLEGRKSMMRQDFRPVYVRNGALYIVDKDQLIAHESFITEAPIPYIMPRERSINIDTPFDLEMAEWMISRNAK